MELVIALIIFAGLAYYLFSKHRQMESEQEPTPYKVEAPAPVVEAPTVPIVVAGNPVVAETPVAAKKPRQLRQPAAKPAAKPAVKKAQPAKKPAAIQAASKAKKPRTPKAK